MLRNGLFVPFVSSDPTSWSSEIVSSFTRKADPSFARLYVSVNGPEDMTVSRKSTGENRWTGNRRDRRTLAIIRRVKGKFLRPCPVKVERNVIRLSRPLDYMLRTRVAILVRALMSVRSVRYCWPSSNPPCAAKATAKIVDRPTSPNKIRRDVVGHRVIIP